MADVRKRLAELVFGSCCSRRGKDYLPAITVKLFTGIPAALY